MKKMDLYILYLKKLGEKISAKTLNFLPSFFLAIIIFVIGKWLIRVVLKLIKKSLIKYEVDSSLAVFFRSICKLVLHTLLIISIISILGFPTTSFIAILSAVGLAVGLALQGSLSNFAGGILILFFKPFKIGDTIESNNCHGVVTRIDILHTRINTPDNKVIILPNGYLANNNIINFTKENKRRIDIKLQIDIQNDLSKVRNIILDVLKKDKRIYAEPAAIIFIEDMKDQRIYLTTRFWTDTLVCSEVQWESIEKIKEVFEINNIKMPNIANQYLLTQH